MNYPNNARGLRPPPGDHRDQMRSPSNASHRSASSLSSAEDAAVTAIDVGRRRPYQQPSQPTDGRPSTSSGEQPSSSSASLTNFSRPQPRGGSIDSVSMRTITPSMSQANLGHRARQHSQGFFEPSLPHVSPMNSISASQIAAQAAMSHLGAPSERKRSVPGLAPINTAAPKRAPSPAMTSPPLSSASSGMPSSNTIGGRLAATTAANAVFPRSPLHSPNTQTFSGTVSPPPQPVMGPPPPVPDKDKGSRVQAKMKLFSKPNKIGISSKDKDYKPPLPSPSKGVFRPSLASASTTSLVESTMSSASSIYSAVNGSTSTLVPSTTASASVAQDKEKHRPHFLSRQKKTAEKGLPLSSAASNSQAVDPSAPQSLYSFTPQSPGVQSSFAKSMSGLDLRHGGRALRERKKEEKAATSLSLTQVLSNSSVNIPSERDYLVPSSLGSETFFGPASTSATSTIFENNQSAQAFNSLGNTMGLSGMTPDDAWPLLKARILSIFEGEDIRTPIEDFNLLASVHIRRCVQKRAPVVLVEDLRELLFTGFSSLAQTLRYLPEERLVPNLVEMWHMVYCTILPFVQAVFLPLDREFRGHGSIMTSEQAAEFWGAMPDHSLTEERPSSSGGTVRLPSLGEELDVRRITLIMFRDTVILPRHEQLLTIFSRLSLETINATPSESMQARSRGPSIPTLPGAERPGTGGSLSPRMSSYNSQSSTLLDAASNSSGGNIIGRSRATSNTSAGSFGTSLPHIPSPNHGSMQGAFPPPGAGHARTRSTVSITEQSFPMRDPAQVTETVARMLQCVSVLSSVQTGDHGQSVIERLTGALKWNWLGRGRTGRQRKGFVGMRVNNHNNTGGASARTGTVGA